MKNKNLLKDCVIVFLTLCLIIILVFIYISSRNNDESSQQYLEELNENLVDINKDNHENDKVTINEINQDGWIELVNYSEECINLNGYSLLYDGKIIYSFGEEELSPNSFSVVELKIDFGNEDGIISLKNELEEDIVHILVPTLSKSQSYGLVIDGGEKLALMSATKGFSNEDAEIYKVNVIDFSVESGFYESEITLEMEADSRYKIYYTLDGTKPTTASLLYDAPVLISNRSGGNYLYTSQVETNYYPETINMGTVVRAIAIDSYGNTVDEKTETYFIGLLGSNNYENLPVMSITMEENDLFDYFDGIYVRGRSYQDDLISGGDGYYKGNYYNNLKKQAKIKFFEKDKSNTYEGTMNISVLIDSVVQSGQKSFILEGKGCKEGSLLNSFLSGDSDYMILKAGESDNMNNFRNQLVDRLISETATSMPEMEPCIVFLNGEYWGCYYLLDSYDSYYFQDMYQAGMSSMCTNGWRIQGYHEKNEYYDFYNSVIYSDLSNEEVYEELLKKMDMQNYLDYLCINIYLANGAFPDTINATAWKSNKDNKWRWLIDDIELSMNNKGYSQIVGKKDVTYAEADTYLIKSVKQDPFFQSLLMNETFCQELKFTMEKMDNEIFEVDRVEASIDELLSDTEKQMIMTYKRFVASNAQDYIQAQIDTILSFFENRGKYILRYTDEVIQSGGNQEIIDQARNEGIQENLDVGNEVNKINED